MCYCLRFDWARDDAGAPLREHSTFYVPDDYAAGLAASHPEHFQWVASIHPYDPQALERLDAAAARGARAIKWLPSAQNIDPADARCDRFYAKLAELDMPLIAHAGDERAVNGFGEHLGNPLRLRRPLDAGVRVVVAHCASLGSGHSDVSGAAELSNFALFAQLMDEQRYEGKLFGDISAITQFNRMEVIAPLLARRDWHARLLNGSDYPLPGVVPLVSLQGLVDLQLLDAAAVEPLSRLRESNVLLFDFVLKRSLRKDGQGFATIRIRDRAIFRSTSRISFTMTLLQSRIWAQRSALLCVLLVLAGCGSLPRNGVPPELMSEATHSGHAQCACAGGHSQPGDDGRYGRILRTGIAGGFSRECRGYRAVSAPCPVRRWRQWRIRCRLPEWLVQHGTAPEVQGGHRRFHRGPDGAVRIPGPARGCRTARVLYHHASRDIFALGEFLDIVSQLLFGEGIADTSPLVSLLERHVDEAFLQQVALAHNSGRRLYIGTVDLDSQRFIIWNMGLIATSGHPDALPLFRKVMLASASIPIAFSPVFFDVEAGWPQL